MKSLRTFILLAALIIISLSSCKKNEAAEFSQIAPINNSTEILPTQAFSCSQVDGATSYIFYFDSGSDTFSVSSSTTYITTTHLKPCATYTWSVLAQKSDGSTTGTSIWQFRMSGSGTIACLLQPSNSSSGLCLSPNLTWTAVTGAASYRLQVANNAGFSSPVISQNLSTNYYTIPGNNLAANTTYYWRVAANGGSTYSAVYSFATVPNPQCATPAAGSTGASRTPSFSWSSSDCTSSYTLEISDISTFSNHTFTSQVSGNSFSLPATNTLNALTTYYWRVSTNDYTSVSGTSTFTTGL